MKIDFPTLENLATSIIIIEPNTSISFVNKKFTQLTGYSKKELIGKSWTKLVYKKDLKKMIKYHKQRRQNKKTPKEYDFRFINKKKKIKWVHVKITMIPKTKKIIALVIDITKRKEAEERLKKSEEKFRLIYKTSNDALMTLEPPSWKFTSGNPSIVKIFGVKNEKEFIKLTPWQVSPKYQPDGQLSSTKAKKMINIAMKKGVNFFEWTHKTIQGKKFLTTVLLNRVKFKKKIFLHARVKDITKSKKAEEKLIISDVIYKNVPSGIAFLDKNYKLISYNPAYAKMIKKNTPFTAKQAIGKTYWNYCPGSKPQVYKWYSTVMKTGKTIAKYNFPLKIKTKKEEKTTYWDTTVVAVKKEGKIIGILINTNDVTKKFEAEQKIIEMNEMKSRFIRNASHELKTPITVMMMDVDLLKQQCQKNKLQKEKIKEIIEMLDRNIKRLNHTTENILDFEKIRKGTTNLFLKKRNLNKTIQETYEEMKTVIKNKKIKIIKKFDKIPDFYFDKEKIKRVITNLLDNAIKFSDKNSKVIITTKKEKNKAVVIIRDYGTGIKEKKISKLFEPFYKAETHEKGTGIGLSISRETIQKHGGRIWAEKQDKGAKFIFEIPIKQNK